MHLAAGVTAGLVILIMSVTGVLLALQPQILDVLERGVRRVRPSPGAERSSIQAIAGAAAASRPGVQVASVTLERDPERSALVALNPAGTLFVDPYTGAVLGEGAARARAIFRTLTDWHRWLGQNGEGRSTARAITGASNLAFLGLAVSGLFLWWPRQWTVARVRAVTVFDVRARGTARDFNWHNAIGFWCAPILIVLTLSGVVISYPWATNLVYRLTGSTPPASAAGAGPGPRQAGSQQETRPGAQRPRDAQARQVRLPENLDALWARAGDAMPTWNSIVMRLPARSGGPVSFTITDAAHWNRFARSTLTLDGATGDVVRWEPYADTSLGQKVRGWLRFAHTGELGGIVAQVIAGLACLGGAFLVWTGISLALRRFLVWRTASPRAAARAA